MRALPWDGSCRPIGRTRFNGVAYDADGQVTYYDTPKLLDL
jgi:hypothetical protein